MSGIAEAIELTEAAVELLRQRLMRTYPNESPEQIEKRIDAWCRERPGAEFGDAEGTPGKWPR
jgi:hypothetical protein